MKGSCRWLVLYKNRQGSGERNSCELSVLQGIAFGKGDQRVLKDLFWGANQAGTDLANARFFMRDPGVDPGCDAQFDNLADVNPGRCASEVEGGNGDMLVFGRRDLVHLERRVERGLGSPADKGDDGRSGRHGESPDAGGLGDRAVADIGVCILAGEPAEGLNTAGSRMSSAPIIPKPANAPRQ